MIKLKKAVSPKSIVVILLLIIIICLNSAQTVSAESKDNIINTVNSDSELFADKRINLNFKDISLKKAVIIMADMAGVNLICDDSVAGRLTVIFDDILFADAFELISRSYNLDYRIFNGTIYVSGEKIIEQNTEKKLFKNIYFKHISRERAASLLENNFKNLKINQLSVNGLLLKGSKEDINYAENMLKKADKPYRQVLIKARVEEISRNKLKEIGVNTEQLSQIKIISDKSKINELEFSWPETLKILEEKGASKILANPQLITLDRKKAKLVIGDQIPVKLESVEDDKAVSSLSYIEAGIVLEFFPKIINKKQVMLEVKPSVNSIGQVFSDGLPAVNSRSAETTVILKEGEMLAIGGLIKEDMLKTSTEVPILSEIPILGQIFTSEEKREMHTELMIFIRTEIIEADTAALDKMESLKDEMNNINKDKNKDENKDRNQDENQDVDKNSFTPLTEGELKNILGK